MLLANLPDQILLMIAALPEPLMMLLAGATLIGATVAARQFFKQLDGKSKNDQPADDAVEPRSL